MTTPRPPHIACVADGVLAGLEHILEPPRRLQYAWDQMQPKNMALRMLKMGETYAAGEVCGDACVEKDRSIFEDLK